MHNTSNNLCLRVLTFLSVGLLCLGSLRAQFIDPGQTFGFGASYSTKSAVRHSVKLGEMSVAYSHAEYSYGFSADEDNQLMAGIRFARTDFDVTDLFGGRITLPDRLENLSFTLAAEHKFSQQLAFSLAVQPGFRGSDGHMGRQAFSTPVVFGGSYAQSKELIWLFGLAYNEFSEYQFVPVAGVIWNLSPKWTLSIGFPRTGVTYRATDALKLYANLSVEGGSYYVKGSSLHPTGLIVPGQPPYPPTLRDTFLDYREVRVGSGLEYRFGGLTLNAEAGVVTTRRWEYHQQDYEYRGRPAGFASLSLKTRF